MEQNITMYIGSNASGKTRILESKIKETIRDNKKVVTNIKKYENQIEFYRIDKKKIDILKKYHDDLYEDFKKIGKIGHNRLINKNYEKLLQLISAEGDTLVINNFDSLITTRQILRLSAYIADIRKLWSNIYIECYKCESTRMFSDLERYNYTETYNSNLIWVEKDGTTLKINEDIEMKYFNKLCKE